MMQVGIIGASGAVGSAIARHLGTDTMLRLGARRPDRIPADLSKCDIVTVDILDHESLGRFCSGCQVVVNAAGPTSLIMDRILRAAHVAGADYVDAAGDEPVFEMLQETPADPTGRTVLSAGIMPGLTALVPRFLARVLGSARTLQGWVGGLDRFTETAAADYVASLQNGHGQASAAWRKGVVEHALAPERDAVVPGFVRPVSAFPYLSRENQRVARHLGLSSGDWYNVFEGQQLCNAFGTVQALVSAGDAAGAVDALCRAAALDLAGRQPYQALSVRLEAADGVAKSMTLRTNDGYALSGAFAAETVRQVMDETLPVGVHFAGETLDPERVIEGLRHSPAVTEITDFEIEPEPETAVDLFEEGVL